MSLFRHQKKAEIIFSLHSEGKTTKEIATELDTVDANVAYYLKQLGLEPNTHIKPLNIVSKTQAQCSRCNEIKSIKQFQSGRKGKKHEYKFAYCNTCRKKQTYENLNNNVDSFLADRYRRVKVRANAAGIDFNITKEQFTAQFHLQKGLCFYTDVPLVCKVGNGWSERNSLSIDKIIPERGYVLGNVVFSTNRVNTCKSDFSLDEIKLWMPSWYERIIKFLDESKNN